MALGVYISVPFCRSKCSYCNFASNVFGRSQYADYVARVTAEIQRAPELAQSVGGRLDHTVDSIYLGGGTPTLLDISALESLFVTIWQNFQVTSDAEITVECAPGTITDDLLQALLRCHVNRVSLGVQSFIDQEARAVGRLHNRQVVMNDITRLRNAGISNINIDLIAGLPHQTLESWRQSLGDAIHTGAPHVSIYMLEIDEDSRLGHELIAGGTKYHAHFVPDADLTADMYEAACRRLEEQRIHQYEISNFAREGKQSFHNLKYWQRKPYIGFGVDAHSMLRARGDAKTVRFSNSDSLEKYMAGLPGEITPVSVQAFLQEAFFLGLRLNSGVDLHALEEEFRSSAVAEYAETIADLVALGLLETDGRQIFLTPRGRLLSNEVFERFIEVEPENHVTASNLVR